MQEVKILYLDELENLDYWSIDYTRKQPKDRAIQERAIIEQKLADLLNDGWRVIATGGASLRGAYVILKREVG